MDIRNFPPNPTTFNNDSWPNQTPINNGHSKNETFSVDDAVKVLNLSSLTALETIEKVTTILENRLNSGAEQVFQISNQAATSGSNLLNSAADRLASTLARWGEPFSPSNNPSSLPSELSRGAGSLSAAWQNPPNFSPGILDRTLRVGAKLTDALTGTASALGQFSADYNSGDKTYTQTMVRISSTVLQTSATTAVGFIAASGVSAGISALGLAASGGLAAGIITAAAPIVLGAGAAFAAGYAINQGVSALMQRL